MNARALLQRPTESYTVSVLAFNVDDQDEEGANTDRVEAVRPVMAVPFSDPEALYDDSELRSALTWFGGGERDTLSYKVQAPFEKALEHLPTGTERPKIVIAMLNEFLNSAGEVYNTDETIRVARLYGEDIEVYVLGFNSTNTRTTEARRLYAPLLNSQQQANQAIQPVTANTLETTLLTLLHDHLCVPPSADDKSSEIHIGTDSFPVNAYQRNLEVLWFSTEPIAEMEFVPPTGTAQSGMRQFGQRAWGLMTVSDPVPGTWSATGDIVGNRPLTPAVMMFETTQYAAQKDFEVTVDGVRATPRVGQQMQISWWMKGANGEPLHYTDSMQQLRVRATLTLNTHVYEVDLDYAAGGDQNMVGKYVGSFHAALPGSYVVEIEPLMAGTDRTLSRSSSNLDTLDLTEQIIVQPIELDVNAPTGSLKQFDTWAFDVALRDSITNALVEDFVSSPTVNATIIVEGKEVQELTVSSSGDGVFVSNPIILLYSDFTLRVTAEIADFNRNLQQIGEPVLISESAEPDPGTVRFTNLTPYLLQEIQIEYEPARLSPAELVNQQIQMYAEVAEEVDDDTGVKYLVEMQPQDGRFTAPFYAARAVPHSLILLGFTNTGDEIFRRAVPDRLIPYPVEVRYEGPAKLQQFDELDFRLDTVSSGQPIAEWVPSPQAKLIPNARLLKDGEFYASLSLLPSVDNAYAYQSSSKLDENGVYTVQVEFVAQRSRGALSGDPSVTLPSTGSAPIEVSPPLVALSIVDAQGELLPHETQALWPITLDFSVGTTFDAMHGPFKEQPRATLWLTYPDGGTEIAFNSVDYDTNNQRFRVSDFIPVQAGEYRLEAGLTRPQGGTVVTLISKEQVPSYNFTVTPVFVCGNPPDKPNYRPGEALEMHFWLCTGDGRRISAAPPLIPPLTLDLQQVTGDQTEVPGNKWPSEVPITTDSDHPTDYYLNGYAPQQPGNYRFDLIAVLTDSNGYSGVLTLPPDARALEFTVGEARLLRIRDYTSHVQDDMTQRWFVEDRRPLVVEFGVETLGSAVSLTAEELGCKPADCFRVELQDEDGRPVAFRLGSPVISADDQRITYRLYDLPRGWREKANYTVKIGFVDPGQLKFPYFVAPANEFIDKEIAYGPELLDIVWVPGLSSLLAVLVSILVYRLHWVVFAPRGLLQVLDSRGRLWFEPFVLNENRNRYTIRNPWPVTLIDRIEIRSSWLMQRRKRIRVIVYLRNGSEQGEKHILKRDGDPKRLNNSRQGYSLIYTSERGQDH